MEPHSDRLINPLLLGTALLVGGSLGYIFGINSHTSQEKNEIQERKITEKDVYYRSKTGYESTGYLKNGNTVSYLIYNNGDEIVYAQGTRYILTDEDHDGIIDEFFFREYGQYIRREGKNIKYDSRWLTKTIAEEVLQDADHYFQEVKQTLNVEEEMKKYHPENRIKNPFRD